MATIGTFRREGSGYRGLIRTLTLEIEAEFRLAQKEHEKSPDFRVHGPHG